MRKNQNVLIFINYFLLLIIVHFSYISESTKCYTKMISSCKNNEITKWNKKNVGQHIKQWIKSLVIEHLINGQPSNEAHCKAFVMKEMPFFSIIDPDIISPYGVILGNVLSGQNASLDDESKKEEAVSSSMKLQFDGSVWADLNNDHEWIIEDLEDKMSAKLSPDAILRNGLYYGELNNNEMKIEENITFVYPDMKTVITGKFRNGVLIEGKPAKVVAERCRNGMKEISISSPNQNSPALSFKRNNDLRIHQPAIIDPFEKNGIFVKNTTEKGEGLFARRNFERNEIVSYYSGVILPSTQVKTWSSLKNRTGYDRHVFSQYLIDHESPAFKLNILEEYWKISNYRATLGHKANHSFINYNCQYISVIHPRFGPISAIQSIKRIDKGDEILTNYGYKTDQFVGSWYVKTYEKELKLSWPGKYVYDENDYKMII